MSTRIELLNGADFEGDESWCETVVNAIKNHFRASNPCTNMTDKQPGEIVSDADDDKLYHVGGESGYPCDEILQATRSCDIIPEFLGVDFYDACDGDYARIKAVDEPGLGHRLTVGLDETTRTMVICDLEDVDVDLGLAAQANPTLYIFNAVNDRYGKFLFDEIALYDDLFSISYTPYYSLWESFGTSIFRLTADLPGGNAFEFDSNAGIELTNNNTEQVWIYIEPKINQTSTAGYIAILVDVTETSLGDASAGAGYNALLDLRVAGTTQFGIQNAGEIMTNQVEAGAIGAYDTRLPVYNGAGSFVGYIAIYAAP